MNPIKIAEEKAAKRVARKLASGNHSWKKQGNLVSEWAKHCKAFIGLKNGR